MLNPLKHGPPAGPRREAHVYQKRPPRLDETMRAHRGIICCCWVSGCFLYCKKYDLLHIGASGLDGVHCFFANHTPAISKLDFLTKNQDFSRWANEIFKISQDGTFPNRDSRFDAVHFFCSFFLLSSRILVQVFDPCLVNFHDFSFRTLLPEAQKEQTLHAFMLPPSLAPTRFACF